MRDALCLLTVSILTLASFFFANSSFASPFSDFMDQRIESLAGETMEQSFSVVKAINHGESANQNFCPVKTQVLQQTEDGVHTFRLPQDFTDGEEIEAWSHCTGRMDPKDQRSTPGTALNTPKDHLHHGFLNAQLSSNDSDWNWQKQHQRCGALSDNMKSQIAGNDVHHAIGKFCEKAPSCEDMKNELGDNYMKAYNSLPDSEKERIPDWESFKRLFETTQFDTQRVLPQKLPPNMLLASMYVLSKGDFLKHSEGYYGAFMIPSHDDKFFRMDPFYENTPTITGEEEENPGFFTKEKTNIDSSLYSPGVSALKFVQRLQRGWRSVQKYHHDQFKNLSTKGKWQMSLFSALHRGNVGRDYFASLKTFNNVTQCNSCETIYNSDDCSDVKRYCSNPGAKSCGERVEYNAMNFERMLGIIRQGYPDNQDSKLHCLGKKMTRYFDATSACDMALMHTQVRNIMRLSQCK